MAVNTAVVSGRRQLHFADFSQLLAEAEYVAHTPSRTLGNWSVAQILNHLGDAANCPFDGYGGLRASWVARYLVVPFIKNNVLTRPMSPGFQLPKTATALLPGEEISPADAYLKLEKALARFAVEHPTHAHPLLGELALQEWVALTLRHAEMHLSFVIPEVERSLV